MIKKLKKELLLLFTIIVLSVCYGNFTHQTVQAAGKLNMSQPVKIDNLQVQLIFPKEQVGSVPYFNLLLPDGVKTDLGIKVTNLSDKDTEVSLTPNNATTNKNMKVVYNQQGVFNTKSKLTELISSKKITLKKKQSKVVKYNFKGVKSEYGILGAINIQEKGFDNTLTVAVNIKSNAAKAGFTELSSSRSLLIDRTALKKINNKLYFVIKIMNNGGLISNADIKADLLDNTNVKIGTLKKKSISIAPNTEFPVYIKYDSSEQLSDGKYKLLLNFVHGDDTYSTKKAFTLSKTETDKLNRKYNLRTKHKNNINYVKISSVIVVLCIVLFIVIDQIETKTKEKK